MSDSFEESPQRAADDTAHEEPQLQPQTAAEEQQDPQVETNAAEASHGTSSANESPARAAGCDATASESDYATSPEKTAAASSKPPVAHSSRQQPASGSTSRTQHRADESPNRSNAGSRNDGRLPQLASSTRRSRLPLVASVSYPARQEGLTVADFLDPSKPLVKSTAPLTKPRGPSFADESTADVRKQHHAEVRMHSAITSSQITAQRNNERKYLKAQYEFEREKKIAERAIYHKERCMQWQQRLGVSPLAVDLVADNERIEEEAYIREKEEKHRQAVAERRKQRIKRAIIVKALAEVPLLEKARKEKRELVDGEKREKALRDVQRVEAIQQRKILDQELMLKERQAKLDQRILSSSR